MSKNVWIGIVLVVVAAGSWLWMCHVPPPEGVVFLDQGWSNWRRHDFYTRSQGSRMIPYAWMTALQRADAPGTFLEDGLSRHGFLPFRHERNPDGLPVGWVPDEGPPVGEGDSTKEQRWLGLTCAACHTSQLEYEGTTIQIDGGQALADFGAFMADLDGALRATLTQPSRFDAFAREVLGDGFSPEASAGLKDDVQQFADGWAKFMRESTMKPGGTPREGPWGRGRVDAFGVIFNRVAVTALGVDENWRDANAPVSYPFLWGTHYADYVQWHADTKNEKVIERLGRNVGEVLGVFGQVDLTRDTGPWPYYRTSIRRVSLLRIERSLSKLKSPLWPEKYLPALDEEKRSAGEALFNDYCARCHEVVSREPVRVEVVKIPIIGSDPDLPPAVREVCEVQSLDTDKQMAENAATRRVKTGSLEGAEFPLLGQRLGPTALSVNLVAHVALGAILAPPSSRDALVSTDEGDDDSTRLISDLKYELGGEESVESRYKRVHEELGSTEEGDPPPKQQYKGRSLDGIWATAPFLHNGSVPSLYDLLRPARSRPATFHVGDPTFDPVRVGFITTPSPRSVPFDTRHTGNGNGGHEGPYYTQRRDGDGWRDFTEKEIWELIEYMKGL